MIFYRGSTDVQQRGIFSIARSGAMVTGRAEPKNGTTPLIRKRSNDPVTGKKTGAATAVSAHLLTLLVHGSDTTIMGRDHYLAKRGADLNYVVRTPHAPHLVGRAGFLSKSALSFFI
jgi:hypothetical protein